MVLDVDKVKRGDKFIHINNKNVYEFIGIIKFKSPDTGIWHTGVLYKDYKTKKKYCRSLNSFNEKFMIKYTIKKNNHNKVEDNKENGI